MKHERRTFNGRVVAGLSLAAIVTLTGFSLAAAPESAPPGDGPRDFLVEPDVENLPANSVIERYDEDRPGDAVIEPVGEESPDSAREAGEVRDEKIELSHDAAHAGSLPDVTTRVYAGGCIVSPPPAPSRARNAREAAVSSLIATSLNRLGSALRAAGGRRTRTAVAQKNLDPAVETQPQCVQLIRGRFRSDPYTIKAGSGDIPCDTIRSRAGGLPGRVRAALEARGVALVGDVDLFVEAALRRSEDDSAWALSPSLIHYGKTLDGRTRRRERALALQVSFHPAGETADGGSAKSGVVVFGASESGTTRCFDPIDGRGARALESAWFENPILPAAPNKPLTVTAALTETRSERPLLLFLADVFEGSEEALQEELERSLIASKQKSAELDEYAARQAALVDAQARWSDAELEKIAYCALTDDMTAPEKAKRLAASTELYKAQMAANIAARVAGLPEPYPDPITPSSGPKTGC